MKLILLGFKTVILCFSRLLPSHLQPCLIPSPAALSTFPFSFPLSFHPLPYPPTPTFIYPHIHLPPLSSIPTFIYPHFPLTPPSTTPTSIYPHFHLSPLSSTPTFIYPHFHLPPPPLSSNPTFNYTHFHLSPLSSTPTFIYSNFNLPHPYPPPPIVRLNQIQLTYVQPRPCSRLISPISRRLWRPSCYPRLRNALCLAPDDIETKRTPKEANSSSITKVNV